MNAIYINELDLKFEVEWNSDTRSYDLYLAMPGKKKEKIEGVMLEVIKEQYEEQIENAIMNSKLDF